MRPRVTSAGLIILPDPARNFTYPAHIDRASLDALPHKPGVYLFRNRQGAPIYIGKSINIRSRVLSHLRTPQEAAMLQSTCKVDFLRTAGEIGALLLESQLIKELQPAYNAQLRVIRETYAIGLQRDPRREISLPYVVGSTQADFTQAPIYGLFTSRSAAQEGLHTLIRQHRLCPAMTGLETVTLGRACFSHQLGICLGVCVGKESAAHHEIRLRACLAQLQASVWPYSGAVGIIEECGGWRQTHVVERWYYLGTLEGRRKKLKPPAKRYIDIDTYKILIKPLLRGELHIQPFI